MKNVALFTLWLLATAAAVAIASAGVGVVSDEVIEPAPATRTGPVISTAEALTQNAGADTSSTRVTSTTTTSPTAATAPVSTPAPSTPAPSTPRPSTPTPTTPTPSTPTPSSPAPSTPPPSTTTAPPVPTSTTTPTPTTVPTTTTAAPRASTVTFDLVGGSTAISFAPGDVRVLWATPNPGFDVDIEPESPGVKVEFRSDDHRSRVDAWWDGGPRHEIREEPED